MSTQKMTQKWALALVTGCVFAAPSQAATVSYFLNQSNALPDGINYLQVTISDEGAPGSIDFKVEVLQPLLDLAGDNFGIQKFAFNILPGVDATASDVDALPANWRARNAGRMSGFGLFDVRLQGRGSSRQDPLTFSITGVTLDTILSYVDLSTGRSPEGRSLFAAHVAGFNLGNCGDTGEDDEGRRGPFKGREGGGQCVTSAYFGGSGNAVPAPPAVWLLATGIAGLAVRRCRSAKA